MRTSERFEDFWAKAQAMLKQASRIDLADAKRWWESLDADRFHDESWHLRRLTAVGGSEAGALVAARLGLPAPFDVLPEDLWDRKLMRVPLEPANDAMTFGNQHEPDTQAAFEDRIAGRGWVRADDAMAKLESAMQDGALDGPIGYSPDDLFIDGQGRYVLVDYKTPYRLSPPQGDDPVPLAYGAQLHQGRAAFERVGIKVERMLLVYGLHPKSWLPERDRGENPQIKLTIFEVDHSPELTAHVLEGAQALMDAVLSGDRPDAISPETAEQVRSLDARLLSLRVASARIEADIKAVTDDLNEIVKSIPDRLLSRLDSVARPAISYSPAVTDDELTQAIEASGQDVAGFRKKGKPVLDVEALLARVRELDPDFKDADFMRVPESWDVGALREAIRREDLPADLFQRSARWSVPASAIKAATQDAKTRDAAVGHEQDLEAGAAYQAANLMAG